MTRVADTRKLAESLEHHLGDPHDPRSPVPFHRVLDLDEREQYPHVELDHLHRWGCQDFGHPVTAGGRGRAIQDSICFGTTIARRDATLATALSITMLAWMPIWVAGDEEQRARYGAAVRTGAKFSWGLSEREHGSDLVANTMTGRKVDGGWIVDGEKWLIGNCTQADYVVLFVRTAQRGGPAGFTILVLDKRSTPAPQVQVLADERLHGLRGIDMSGLRLSDCFIPDSAQIGATGRGLEIALQSSHPVRIMITGISMGCADTALRLTLDFATRREIFGRTVAEVPYSRLRLAESFADLLASSVVATCAARSLQSSPGQSSVWSSATKYLLPTVLDRTVSELAVVLGARHYLRGHPRFGAFQKMARDLTVANFADGNTTVNLKNLALQLDTVLDAALDADEEAVEAACARSASSFDWDAELDEYSPAAASTFSRTGDDALTVLPDTARRLDAFAETAAEETEARRWRACARFAERLRTELRSVRERSTELRAELGRDYGGSAELFVLAERFAVLHAAAVCLAHRAHSQHWIAAPLDGAAPLLLCLQRLWQRLHPTETVADRDTVEATARAMFELHARPASFCYRSLSLPSSDVDIPVPL